MESDSASCWSSNFEIGSDQRLKKVSSSKCVNGLTWKLFPSSLVHLFLQNGFYNSQKLFAITSRWKKFTISTTYLLTYLQKYIPTYKSTYLPTKAQTYLQKHKPTYLPSKIPTYKNTYYLPTYIVGQFQLSKIGEVKWGNGSCRKCLILLFIESCHFDIKIYRIRSLLMKQS